MLPSTLDPRQKPTLPKKHTALGRKPVQIDRAQLYEDLKQFVIVIGLSGVQFGLLIRVITKSDDRAAGVQFVYHEYDYRLNWTTRSLITNYS